MHISCALFHTSRRHLPQKGGLRATSRQIIFFHFRFMNIMFRWFSAPKIYAAPAHAVTNMFHRLQLLLNATFLAHNETFFTPSPPQGGILLCSANIMILLHNFSHLLYCSAASPGRFLVSADFCNFVGLFMKI